ncbi:hypothetical protein ACWOFR_00185 [Carnobacterium gallinarum]|uniref:hypothetical protein n=1 Tax=Carnobacterium gallinarum TaxID=2749 RepID=UPI0005500D87|nr:hypothetical protein [Carnobacterium gallinarum]
MDLNEIRAKRRRNEEAQDDLFVSRKKFDYHTDETRQAYVQNKLLKEDVLEYFYGEPEQYLFEDGLEENRRNESFFLESSEEITEYLSKEKIRLTEENEALHEQELNEFREEDAHGKNGVK